MVVLGIDPGIGRMGWGAIIVQSSKCKVQSCGCIETAAKLRTEERLLQIYQDLTKIIKEYQPDVLAIEELFFGANAKTALVVGQARGVALLVAGQNKLPIAVYTPLQVKVALTGYGRAEKNQIGQMVKVLLKLSSIPKPDDTADALAVALTHAFSRKYGVLTSKKR
ncbi:MAG: crossover junction endodeoxyribonuclease RuvC [Candidatus Levybacteria bacterium]|nr:crossover junction endodeoxyribonuclease RuvC [Candidatus Levybacteria bacterium]